MKSLSEKIKSILHEDMWNIGIIESPIENTLDGNFSGFNKASSWIQLSKENEFAADPFIEVDNKDPNVIHIFFELFSFKSMRGTIAYAKYHKLSKTVLENKVIIEEKFHLSYPYLFKDKNKYYIIPESSEANKILLYECLEFPYKWKKSTLIDDFPGIDNSIIKFRDTYWLFSNNKNEGQHTSLNIFHSKKLKGNWLSHKQNPVIKDIGSSRCAGRIIESNNTFFRPSMNNTYSYGKEIVMNKILTLNENEYKEEEVTRIKPIKESRFPDKLHTIGGNAGITVIDSARQISLFQSVLVLKTKLRRLKNKFL